MGGDEMPDYEWLSHEFDSREARDEAAAQLQAEGYEVETFGMGGYGGISSYNLSADRG